MLHDARPRRHQNDHNQSENRTQNESDSEILTLLRNYHCQSGETVSLRTIPVCVTGNGVQMKINACLDDGSHTSFISERAVSYLGLKRNNRDISVKTLNGAELSIASATVTAIEVTSSNGKTKREITAIICPNAVMGDYEPVDWTKLVSLPDKVVTDNGTNFVSQICSGN